MMNKERILLGRIDSMPEPRHLFVVPVWADAASLGDLIERGYLTCDHCQRDHNGAVQVAMALQLTPKGKKLVHPELGNWPRLVFKGSLAGASLTGMSLLILYLA